MSWFYDALVRVEEEKPSAAKQPGSTVLIDEGASFLTALEFITPISQKPFKEHSAEPILLAAETRAKPTPEVQAVHDAVVPIHIVEPPSSENGYPRLTVPVREDSRLVFHADRHGLAAEQYRLLRRNLIQDFPKNAVLMITSPGEGDGKTLTALNLATCLAESGQSTLLVELDTRRPTLRKVLGCEISQPGIEDALIGNVPSYESVRFIEEFSLHVAMVARIPRDPSRLMNGRGVREFLSGARERFRWIVIDSAPAVPASDVADLLSLTDGVLLVIRAQSTPRDLAKRAFELLGRRLHGVILNEATVHSNPHYRYLGHYYHGPK